MKKLIKDGYLCVLYSPGWGSGWWTDHRLDELLFDPTLVEMVLRKAEVSEMEEYCITAYGQDLYLGALDSLDVAKVPVREPFTVDVYDGDEFILLQSDVRWFSA